MRVAEQSDTAGNSISLGEYGWDGWTGNYFTIHPHEELILLYFVQRCGAGGMPLQAAIREIREVTYSSLRSEKGLEI